MSLMILIALIVAIFAVLSLIGTVIALVLLRPLLAVFLGLSFIVLLALAVGIGLLWVVVEQFSDTYWAPTILIIAYS